MFHNNSYNKKYIYLRMYTSSSTTTTPIIPTSLSLSEKQQQQQQTSFLNSTTTCTFNDPSTLIKIETQEEYNNNGRKDAYTSIAMKYYAKEGRADLCLQYYLKYLQSHGKLPSREALHQLTRVLYLNNHLSGLLTLHDTLLAYYKLHPPSRSQINQLSYVYTMLINTLIHESNSNNNNNNSKHSHSSTSIIHNNNDSNNNSKYRIKKNKKDGSSSSSSSSSLSSSILKDKATIFKIIIKLCQEMQQFNITKTTVLYNSLIHWRVQQNDPELAWAIYQELRSHCSPTNYTYTTLLHLTRMQKDYHQMLQLLDDMKASNIIPDRTMVSVITLTLCDHYDYINAKLFLDQLLCHAPHILSKQYKSTLLNTIYTHYQQVNRHHHQRQQYSFSHHSSNDQFDLNQLQKDQVIDHLNNHNHNHNNKNNNNHNSNNNPNHNVKLTSKEKRRKYIIKVMKKKQKRRIKLLQSKQSPINNDLNQLN
ncbi:unnamed protein product [Cunninghamella blakesleeana]